MNLPSLSTIRLWLLIAVLFGGAMALHPSISLPILDFPSFRLGFYQILMLSFVASCLPLARRGWDLLRQPSSLIIILPLTLALLVGLMASLTLARTAMYSTALIAVLIIGLCAGLTFTSLDKSQRRTLFTAGLWSGILFGIVALIQLVLASVDPTAFGTLCSGCKPNVFGFARINGLAAEPQFMASALLPAMFVAMIFRDNRRLANSSLFFSSLAITLTFSRGAFAAIAGAIVLLTAVRIIKKLSVRPLLAPILVAVVGVLVGFALLVGSATIRFADTPHITYNTTVSMVDQLSLGLVSIPQKTTKPAPTPITGNQEPFTPEGYVEASSEERLDAADIAIEAWADSPRTVLFGTGLGNLGSYIQRELVHPVPTDQTVYIFYILLLSSLGIVGLLPLVVLTVLVLWRAYRHVDQPFGQLALLLSLAILIQFWFFGSFINVVHCFAWIGVFLYNLPKES